MTDHAQYDLVEVEWEDSFTEKEVQLTSIKAETVWHTIGYLLRDDPSRVVLGISLQRDEDSQDIISIPRGMVREVRYLGRRRK